MTIQFKEKMENYNAKKQALAELVQNNASSDEQDKAFGEMMDALSNDLHGQIKSEMQSEQVDSTVLASRNINPLTSSEKKFFNAINTDVGYKDEALLPVTTQERVFESLRSEFPLLNALNIQNMGLMARVIKADPSGAAVWGPIFGDIKGQLDAAFKEEDISQSKLTAFVVVPNDLEEYGPEWVERFVRAQIVEAFSTALELAYVGGSGQNQPIGLMKDVAADTGAVTDKASAGTLTFADPETTVKELHGVMGELSIDAEGKTVSVEGNAVLAINPADAWGLKAAYTHLNATGLYVTTLPFNIQIVESPAVPAGKLVGFVKSRYTAAIGGGAKVKKFDQTLALEDCQLYTAKTFAYGKPDDNKASVVYDIPTDVAEEPAV